MKESYLALDARKMMARLTLHVKVKNANHWRMWLGRMLLRLAVYVMQLGGLEFEDGHHER